MADGPFTLRVLEAAPSAAATLVIGLDTIFAPLLGGVLVPNPDIVVAGLVTDGSGAITLDATFPGDLPTGFVLNLQVLTSDGTAPQGTSFTNGLAATAL